MFKTLKQGEYFKKNQNKYKNLINPVNLSRIAVGKLNVVNNVKSWNFGKVIEGITGSGGTPEINPVEQANLAEMRKLQKLEGEFNAKMTEYKDNYKKYLEQLAARQRSVTSQYRNKVVRYGSNYFYVNSSGVARAFTAASWAGKDNSCPQSSATLSAQDYSKLPRGSPMGTGELCRSGAWNAMDSGSGTTAWVDDQGYKHIYTDFRNRNTSCPADSTKITSVQFNAIPTGNSFGNADRCTTISLSSPLYTQLVVINNKLMSIVTEMHEEVGKLKTKDKSLASRISQEKKKLKDTLALLKVEKDKVKKMQIAILKYKAEAAEQNLDVPSIQMHHMIWAILILTLGATIYKAALEN